MRIALLATLAVVLGVGIGLATTLSEFGVSSFSDYGDSSAERSTLATAGAPLLPVHGPPPKTVLAEARYEFGEMDQDEVGRHVFVIKNEGPGVLEIDKGQPSCRCTIANVSKQRVEPNDSAEIAVEWRATMFSGDFARTITFHTNDPAKAVVTFEIHGHVLTAFRLEPSTLMLGSLGPQETREAKVKFLVFKDGPCEILGHQWDNRGSAEYFGLVYEPLSKEELAKDQAKSGYELTIIARGGAPLGPISQTLTLQTSLKTKTPINLQIIGQVAPEVSLAGPSELNADKKILFLGVIPRGTSRATQFQMMLCGPRRNDTTFKVAKVVPKDLQVTIDKARTLPGGSILVVPLHVEVPKDAQPVALLGKDFDGMGEIVLESNHPDYKEVRIHVRMAVTDASARPGKVAVPTDAAPFDAGK